MSIAEERTIIWFSPQSQGLFHIQEMYPSYAWTSSLESLFENHTQFEHAPIILFNLTGFGEESFEKLHAISTILPQIPILIVSETNNQQYIEKALKFGASDFFIGSLNSPLLRQRIEILKKYCNGGVCNNDISQTFGTANSVAPQEMELAFMAFYDELTGLANRKLFFSRLEALIKKEVPLNHSFVLLYVDLDGFKEINDTFTHKAGDWLLQQVAVRLRHGVKKQDTVARVGGDEFCILLADSILSEDIPSITQRIIYHLSSPFFYDKSQIKISASVGIALYPQNAITSHELLNRADLAMYIAKQFGPGNYRFYSPDFEDQIKTHKVS